MPKLKNPDLATISHHEFSVRRRAIGLTNAVMMAATGASVSTVTKWSSGDLPLPMRAQKVLEDVELAVDELVDGFLATHTRKKRQASQPALLPPSMTAWRYGQDSYEVAVSRARRQLDPAVILPPSD